MRAMVSELLPAVKGTISFRGRVGQDWAWDEGSITKKAVNSSGMGLIADLLSSAQSLPVFAETVGWVEPKKRVLKRVFSAKPIMVPRREMMGFATDTSKRLRA